jgi:hypothetical protein
MSYTLMGYTCWELLINSKGRTFLEAVSELNKPVSRPKYTLNTTWREQFWLIYGTWWVVLGIQFPYFYKSPVTGLEFAFIKHQEDTSFLENMIEPVAKYLGKTDT